MNQIVSSRKILVNIVTLFTRALIVNGLGAAKIVLAVRWLDPDALLRAGYFPCVRGWMRKILEDSLAIQPVQ